jgi:hypothetical protein
VNLKRKKAAIVVFTALATGMGICWLIVGCTTGKPSLALSFSHYETNSGTVYGIVQIKNVGNGAASYRSHSFCSDEPFYSLMANSPTGWANVQLGWCGTESHPSVLAADSRQNFRVYFGTNQIWKVGITYDDATFNDRVGSFVPRLWRRYFSRYSPGYSSVVVPAYKVCSQPIEYGAEK